jgi:hypothetical protein
VADTEEPGFVGGLLTDTGDWLRKADTALFGGLANITSPARDPQADAMEDAYLKAIGVPTVNRIEQRQAEGRRTLMDLGIGLGQYAGYRAVPATFSETMAGALQHTLASADQRAGAQQTALARRMQLGQALYSINKQQQGQATFRYMLGLAAGQVPGTTPQPGATGAAGTTQVTPAPMAGGGDYGPVIAGAWAPVRQHESGGDNNARPLGPDGKPLSTAGGPGQFLDGTWLENYKLAYPNSGETDAQILAKKIDPEVSEKVFNVYGNRNAQRLVAAGHPVTSATIALSHFLDGGTAAKLLSSPHNTPLESVLSADAISANKRFFEKNAITTTGALADYYSRKFPSPAAPSATGTAGAPGTPGPAGAPAGAPSQQTMMGALPPQVVALAAAVGRDDPEKGYQILFQAWQAQQLQQHNASNAPRRPATSADIMTYKLDPKQSWAINTVTGQPESLGGKRDDTEQQAYAREDTLRAEFLKLPAVHKYMEATPAYTNLRMAAERGKDGDNPTADVNLIYAVANLFDPGSVVREGEQNAFAKLGGLFSRFTQQLTGVVDGSSKLPPEIRQQIIQAGEDRMRGYWQAVDPHARTYRGLTGQYPGTRADRVVVVQSPEQLIAGANARDETPLPPVPGSTTSTTPAPVPPAPVPPAPTTYTAPAPGTPAFRSTTAPPGWSEAAAKAHYEGLTAEQFGALTIDQIPWFERTLASNEEQRRLKAAKTKGKK